MSLRPPRRKPVLIIQHAQHEHPAAVRRALETQGIPTILIHPYRGEKHPELREISGIISLGGPMSANDDEEHPWIPKECLLLKKSVEANLPTVGICLGGQMMARAMGGRVERHTTTELGWFPVSMNELGRADPIAGAAGPNPTVYQWHGDTFHLPPGAELLGGTQVCERQAYRLGDQAYGFQFHPEADHQLVIEWLSIEGVEEEIQLVQDEHGPATVQDAATQRNYALMGEKGSLKITAAIGGLFHRREFFPVNPTFRHNLEVWTAQREKLVLEFLGSSGKISHLHGMISTVLTIPAGEFVIFQEETTLLWPIRLDDIRKITVVGR